MNVLEAIQARRSCREFSSEHISREDVISITETGLQIPTAGRQQPLGIYFTMGPLTISRLSEAANQLWIESAPCVFVILADFPKIEKKYRTRGRQYALLEAGHAAQNICLAATELGLGSCCVGAFRESKVLAALGLKRDCGLTPVYMVAVGKPKP